MMNGLPCRTVDHLVEDILPANSDIFKIYHDIPYHNKVLLR